MITDEQGREWLLQKLYDDGWRYYVRNIGGVAFLTTKKPVMEGNILEITSGEKIKHADAIRNIMPEINKCVVLDIAEELGIVDWSKVPVDTKILVSCDGCNWFKKYFAKVQNGEIYAWDNGFTSWSVSNKEYCVTRWRYAKLAEV